MSTVNQANKTCRDYYFNQSNLMFIKDSKEMIYALHVLIKNNDLNGLLLQIDQNVIKCK